MTRRDGLLFLDFSCWCASREGPLPDNPVLNKAIEISTNEPSNPGRKEAKDIIGSARSCSSAAAPSPVTPTECARSSAIFYAMARSWWLRHAPAKFALRWGGIGNRPPTQGCTGLLSVSRHSETQNDNFIAN